ncbi:TPA: hypothetical protein R2K44_002409 [Raoultella ornithinolytica]|nr:hypothetical protein [Raoultella ornithinolytica]
MNNKQISQLEKAKQYAINNGGFCLSDSYSGNKEKLLWKCGNENHKEWKSAFVNVINGGSWCPDCKREKISDKNRLNNGLSQAIECAKSHNGNCLSTEYEGNRTKMIWKCENNNHPSWQASFFNVVNSGGWCPLCAKEKLSNKLKNKNGLQLAKAQAEKMGGECLSLVYINSKDKLTWKCDNNNHPSWQASYYSVVGSGRWCPECGKKNIAEERTRLIFERFFGKQFISTKPDWNINPWTNKLLELDGYCEEFKIAFEYDGEHHFVVSNYDGRNKKKKGTTLAYQKFKDEQKRKNCKNNDVLLVNIPFVHDKLKNKFHMFLDNIIKACEEKDLFMRFCDDELLQLEKEFYLIK